MPVSRTPRRNVILRVPKATPSYSSGGYPSTTAGGLYPAASLYGGEYGGREGSSSSASLYGHAAAASGSRRAGSPTKGGGHAQATGQQHTGSSVGSTESMNRGHNRETKSGHASDMAQRPYGYPAQSTSAAEWNSLLIWARRQRGPQWDSATGMWQVDEGSTEYYAFGNDPARHTKLSRASKRPQRPSDGASGSGTDGAGAPGGPASAATPASVATSADTGHAIPWNPPPGHTGPPPPGSAFHAGPHTGDSSNGQGFLGAPTAAGGAMSPQAGDDRPPPFGSGSRRSRAR